MFYLLKVTSLHWKKAINGKYKLTVGTKLWSDQELFNNLGDLVLTAGCGWRRLLPKEYEIVRRVGNTTF